MPKDSERHARKLPAKRHGTTPIQVDRVCLRLVLAVPDLLTVQPATAARRANEFGALPSMWINEEDTARHIQASGFLQGARFYRAGISSLVVKAAP